MTNLSDTQLVILSAACARDDGLVLPLPDRLKGGAAKTVVESLIAKGLIEEVDAKLCDPVWRETGDGHGVTLVVTDAALTALGIEPDDAPAGADSAPEAEAPQEDATPDHDAPVAPTAAAARKTRENSKQAQLIAMLKRPEGATIAEITEAFGWQAHTVRGAIAGALKKKLGLAVTSEKIENRGRVYRILN
ncbi:MAG: DUF3489 domain-containing protein [Rhodospirillales bacterium]|jgi:hypothetical protein|nr:DUF3489 domain-containing protein [Rhodospirillales bacterium]